LIDALERDGALRVIDGVADTPSGVTTASLGNTIVSRMAFVSTPTRELLQTASLLGGGFAVSDLAALMRRRATELAGPLREATASGVLSDTGQLVAFSHPLIRDALYHDMSASLRAALHRDAAQALAEAGVPTERVAAQLLLAGHSVDAWTVNWLSTAAPVLINQAPGAAVDLLRSALDSAPAGDVHRVLLDTRLVAALFQAGRWDEAEQAARRALARVNDPDLRGELYWYLVESLHLPGRFEDALAEIDSALGSPGLGPIHIARLKALAARCRYRGDMPGAAEAAEEALATARQAGDPWAIAYALHAVGNIAGEAGRYTEELAYYDQGEAVAGDDPALADLRVLFQVNRAAALVDLDRYDEARLLLRETRRVTERTGDVRRIGLAGLAFASLEYRTGRWDEALTEAESVVDLTDPQTANYARGLAALVALHRDDAPTARHPDEFTRKIASHWETHLALARALEQERAHHPEQALAIVIDHLNSGPHADSTLNWVSLLGGAEAVRLAMSVGDVTLARDLATRTEQLAGRRDTDIPTFRAAVYYCYGLVNADPALVTDAADLFRGRRPLPCAQALEAAADLYARAGDIPTARRVFTEAITLYTGLGAAWDINRADAHFRALGIRRGRGTGGTRLHTGLASLTPTENKIAQLVAEGQSNPRIADQLFLSRRTVQTHVSHILTKLDLHSRVEIARAISRS
jgi:DNA-binding CsgD family transcriptional regulator/tetratricopeptide (TPR) repeat protein